MKKTRCFILLLALSSSAQAKTWQVGVALANFDLNFVSILRTQMIEDLKAQGIKSQFSDATRRLTVHQKWRNGGDDFSGRERPGQRRSKSDSRPSGEAKSSELQLVPYQTITKANYQQFADMNH